MLLCDVLHDESRFEMALIEKVLVSYFFFSLSLHHERLFFESLKNQDMRTNRNMKILMRRCLIKIPCCIKFEE